MTALLATCFMLLSCLACFSNLKMKAICFSETSLDFQWLYGGKIVFFVWENLSNLLILSPTLFFIFSWISNSKYCLVRTLYNIKRRKICCTYFVCYINLGCCGFFCSNVGRRSFCWDELFNEYIFCLTGEMRHVDPWV